jgi:5-methylcytosine-specific restriction enzyme A
MRDRWVARCSRQRMGEPTPPRYKPMRKRERERTLHDSKRWRRISKLQRMREPLCRMCLEQGKIEPATIADHIVPHRGDPDLFWSGALQSLCYFHHETTKREMERKGYHTTIGADGWPIDPQHPANRGRS